MGSVMDEHYETYSRCAVCGLHTGNLDPVALRRCNFGPRFHLQTVSSNVQPIPESEWDQ